MYRIEVQRTIRTQFTPTQAQCKRWAKAALQMQVSEAELTIRIVSEKEMLALNSTYRHKHYATNVLSFPFDTPNDVILDLPLLGDIVICAAVVNQEAIDQSKEALAHWAHMIIHGTLHLLGDDHEQEDEALIMEAKEIAILNALHYPNPYLDKGTHAS